MKKQVQWPGPYHTPKSAKFVRCYLSSLQEAEDMVRKVAFNSDIEMRDCAFDSFHAEVLKQRRAVESLSDSAKDYLYEACENVFVGFGYTL